MYKSLSKFISRSNNWGRRHSGHEKTSKLAAPIIKNSAARKSRGTLEKLTAKPTKTDEKTICQVCGAVVNKSMLYIHQSKHDCLSWLEPVYIPAH